MDLLLALAFLLTTSATVNSQTLGTNCTDNANLCTDENQECAGTPKTCVCLTGHTIDRTKCREPTYGESCILSVGCSIGLLCKINKCECNNKGLQYYNISTQRCEDRKSHNDTCNFVNSSVNECLQAFICQNEKCECHNPRQNFFNGAQCVRRKTHAITCNSDNPINECLPPFSCQDNACQCLESNQKYYNETQCVQRKSYGENCNPNNTINECLPDSFCHNSVCECLDFNENYYNGTQCIPRKTLNETCNPNNNIEECLPTFFCQDNKCECPQQHYYDGIQCVRKKNYTTECDGNDGECSSNAFECINAFSPTFGKRCLCPSDQFFASGSCRSVTDLRIQYPITATSLTTDSITFSWSANQYGSYVRYRFKNPNTGTTSTATALNGSVSGLTPGTKYEFSVDSYLSADGYYSERSTTFDIPGEFWTKPSKPGSFDAEKSWLKSNPMTFVFQAAFGKVAKYNVTLKHGPEQIYMAETNDTKVEGLNLTLAKTYNYEIFAFNGFGDESVETTGNFTTPASGQVKNFSIKDITANSALVKWKRPTEPNGDIQSFIVLVHKAGSCLQIYTLICDNCTHTTTSVLECDTSITGSSFFISDVDDEEHVFSQNITSLTTYTEYRVTVFAINEKGDGATEDATFTTLESAPVLSDTVVISIDTQGKATESTVSVSLCSSCLTDSKQGKVIHAGLIICIKSTTNTCSRIHREGSAMTFAAFSNFTTWANAKAMKFGYFYRTTPDNWVNILKSGNHTSYSIGMAKNCSSDVTQYCNGPLPAGKEIVVTAMVCTKAGCSESSPFDVKTEEIKGNNDDDDIGMIVGIVVCVIIVIIVVIAVLIYVRMRRRHTESPSEHQFDDLPTLKIERSIPPNSQVEDLTTHKVKRSSPPNDPLVDLTTHELESRPIKIQDFCDIVVSMHKDKNHLFEEQFNEINNISSKFTYTIDEAKQAYNKMRNRFSAILPYDHSRVKLLKTSGTDDGSDFINANYIPGLTSNREYIATQVPMDATIPHFWRMIWEQKSKVIVMLSESTNKGSLYWPNKLKEQVCFGNIVVEMTNVSQMTKTIIRNFKITKNQSIHRVTHFSPAWTDFNGNIDDALEFVKVVRSKNVPSRFGPPVIHCSAGVGRTATFIALDYFMQYIDQQSLDDDIDVFKYVVEMRKSRPEMISTKDLYMFVFDALDRMISKKITEHEEKHMYHDCVTPEENIYINQIEASDKTQITGNKNSHSKDDDLVKIELTYSNYAFDEEQH